ncbi:MAG: 16S rRNA (cytosine(1402)-N(4))-methyltransferase RsmH, partial [Verrucomicrobiota bacterium]
ISLIYGIYGSSRKWVVHPKVNYPGSRVFMIIPIKPWLDLIEGCEATTLANYGFRSTPHDVALSADAEIDELRRAAGWALPSSENNAWGDRMEFYHEPILANEILEAMQPIKGRQIFDGTLGGGGHAEVFLQHGAHVVGCDQDEDALAYASRRLSRFGDQFLPVRGNFAEMNSLLDSHGIEHVDGIVLDLGVSSHQLDDAARGFSFRQDGPLDMRMDHRGGLKAEDLVNDLSEGELTRIFWEFGEERKAVRAARGIVRARKGARLTSTLQLAEVLEEVLPRVSGKHPATRVFQALRIAVNRELECLELALERSVEALSENGVLAVISFHSLEDRIVKHFMRRRSSPFLDRPEWPEPRENPEYCLNLPVRRAIVPSDVEVKNNPRARSAKLRLATKVS